MFSLEMTAFQMEHFFSLISRAKNSQDELAAAAGWGQPVQWTKRRRQVVDTTRHDTT